MTQSYSSHFNINSYSDCYSTHCGSSVQPGGSRKNTSELQQPAINQCRHPTPPCLVPHQLQQSIYSSWRDINNNPRHLWWHQQGVFEQQLSRTLHCWFGAAKRAISLRCQNGANSLLELPMLFASGQTLFTHSFIGQMPVTLHLTTTALLTESIL